MSAISIYGGRALSGAVSISGSKNGALPIMAASLLCSKTVTLQNVPNLMDIETMKDLLISLGAKVNRISPHSLEINCSSVNRCLADYSIVSKMRASIWVLAPLLAKFGTAKVAMPGGCTIGARQIDMHIDILESMGASIGTEGGYLMASLKNGLVGTNFEFKKISVGATVTSILAAVVANGRSTIANCAVEPEIVDLCKFLNESGACIKNAGTSMLEIHGSNDIYGCNHRIIPDRIEAGTYIIAAGITGGKIVLNDILHNHLYNVISQLEKTGMLFEVNGTNSIIVESPLRIISADMATNPYPAFPTDLQAQYMSLMTVAHGKSKITENVFENRFMHVHELCKMGADIAIDSNNAHIQGVTQLSGRRVVASDLRASVCLVLAGLMAKGQTTVQKTYHLDRGYEKLEDKLCTMGASVKRIYEDEYNEADIRQDIR